MRDKGKNATTRTPMRNVHVAQTRCSKDVGNVAHQANYIRDKEEAGKTFKETKNVYLDTYNPRRSWRGWVRFQVGNGGVEPLQCHCVRLDRRKSTCLHGSYREMCVSLATIHALWAQLAPLLPSTNIISSMSDKQSKEATNSSLKDVLLERETAFFKWHEMECFWV